MITAQQVHKSRWRGRYWRRVELELVDGGAVVLDGGSPKALVRISDEGSETVRVEIADVAAHEAARRACVLPKTETLRLRGAGLFEALDAHRRRRSNAVPPPEPPEPPAPRPPAESGPPLPPAPGTDATDAAPTVGALEARLTKLQRSDLERRLAALNPSAAGAAPPPAPRGGGARGGPAPLEAAEVPFPLPLPLQLPLPLPLAGAAARALRAGAPRRPPGGRPGRAQAAVHRAGPASAGDRPRAGAAGAGPGARGGAGSGRAAAPGLPGGPDEGAAVGG